MNFYKTSFFYFLTITTCLTSNDYSDAVYESLSSITDPTEKDYEIVQNYIYYGIIPNISRIVNYRREHYARDFKITPTDGNKIVYEIIAVKTTLKKKDDCIVLYGSYNDGEPEKIYALVDEIQKTKFKGHIIYRIGGWPNLSEGDLVLAHIPGAYKVSALYEAYQLGYKDALWIDADLSPETDFKEIFKKIKKYGLYAYSLPFNFKDFFMFGTQKMAYNLSADRAMKLFTVSTDVVGVDFQDKRAVSFLEMWHNATKARERCSLVPQMDYAIFSFYVNQQYKKNHFPSYEDHVDTNDTDNLEFSKRLIRSLPRIREATELLRNL